MLKLRIQGSEAEIIQFIDMLRTDKRIDLENESDIYDNKGTVQNKRFYTNVIMKDDSEENFM